MCGPTQPRICEAPRSRIRATHAPTTSSTSPWRPAWAAPRTPASGSASSTGTQSATRTISTTSGRSVTSASHRSRGPPASTTVCPCTCSMSARTAPGAKSSRSRPRLRRRAAGSSSPTRARLSESKGTALTPSYLSVNARATGPVLLRWANNLGPAPLLQEVGDIQLVVTEGGCRALRSRLLGTGRTLLGTDGDRLAPRRRGLGRLALLGERPGGGPGLLLRLRLLRLRGLGTQSVALVAT